IQVRRDLPFDLAVAHVGFEAVQRRLPAHRRTKFLVRRHAGQALGLLLGLHLSRAGQQHRADTCRGAEGAAHERAAVELVSRVRPRFLPADERKILAAMLRARAPADEIGRSRGGGAGAVFQVSPSQNRSISRRSAASGSRPRAAAWLSSRWRTCVVPGIATLIAGWDTTYFRSSCAQLAASISAAKSGNSRSRTRAKRLAAFRRPPNGVFAITARPRSWASGRIVSAALRLSIE